MDKYSVYIALMALITFTARYAFFSTALKYELGAKTQCFLSFTAPCILTAMAAPIVFGSINNASQLTNPYLLAGIFTIIISLLIKNTLLVVVFSMSIFSLIKLTPVVP
jgi:branched-subunit amino acid transport protein